MVLIDRRVLGRLGTDAGQRDQETRPRRSLPRPGESPSATAIVAPMTTQAGLSATRAPAPFSRQAGSISRHQPAPSIKSPPAQVAGKNRSHNPTAGAGDTGGDVRREVPGRQLESIATPPIVVNFSATSPFPAELHTVPLPGRNSTGTVCLMKKTSSSPAAWSARWKGLTSALIGMLSRMRTPRRTKA